MMSLPVASPFIGEADFFGYSGLMTDAEQAALVRLRTFLGQQAEPVVDEYWELGKTPLFLRDQFAQGDFVYPAELREAGEALRPLFIGMRTLEISRVDSSLSVLFGGQIGMFNTLLQLGLPAHRYAEYREDIESYRMTGCFALTEPDHGSDISRRIETTATRQGNTWLLNGEKKWIGNAAYSDYAIIVARATEDQEVKAFLASTADPGMTITKVEGKTSLRMVHNAHIHLQNVEVPEQMRLSRMNSFRELNDAFRTLRPSVVWNAVGLQVGLYEATLEYARSRHQFGRPIAGFQLVQEKLVRMLGNLNASLALAVRLAELAETEFGVDDEQAALAKMWVCSHMRESAALGREILGGNGILLENKVARFHADAESLYTFEGTHEINSLIVGRSITGVSAFV